MRVFIFVLFYCLVIEVIYSQADINQEIVQRQDSILGRIELAKDDDERLELIVSLYDSDVENYPVRTLETGQKLLKLSQRSKNLIDESSAMSLFGHSYRLSGNYIKGLEYHLKAISLAEKTGNLSLLAIAQNQMAHIYKDREEYEKALRLYQVSKENAMKSRSLEVILWPVQNLAQVYLAIHKPDSSLFYCKQAVEKYLELKNHDHLPFIYVIMAGAYSQKEDLAQANAYFTISRDILSKSKGATRYMYFLFLAQAEHFLRCNQMDSSLYFAKKAIGAVENTAFSYLSLKPARMLTDLYENLNADSTIKYLRVYRAANDSLFNTRANQQLQMMTMEEDQRQQEVLAERIEYENRIKIYGLIAGLAVFTIIGLILFRSNLHKQKANVILEATLSNLKSTQSQLIQSEKMASLGELTAGIAHEIQNPLNFVNNFSEVNEELIDELVQELAVGNGQSAVEIAKDIKNNQQKILHHGKRADAIVKGMLQHSRSSSGVKEPTDINVLADEYLRLAYHGLRAKDKSFNASMKTDFDESIGNVNVVPQDIGRVILNLITNAFYAVNERLRQAQPDNGYEPTVTVSTKKEGNKVLISVKDNGNGIPQKVLKKIFQPFYTTKPTGQGTGLGLSMSYDIIKNTHQGDIKVESKEGEGAEFIVVLPE